MPKLGLRVRPWRGEWTPRVRPTPPPGRLDTTYAPLLTPRVVKPPRPERNVGIFTQLFRALCAALRRRRTSWAPGARACRRRAKVVALRIVSKRRKPRRHFNTLDRASLKVQNLRHGKLHVLRWLLWEAEMPALEQRCSTGALALHYAAARGCLDCVKLLVEASPEHSANAQMENAVTPVYLAAQEGHLDVLRYLVLEAGGSLLLRAKDGMAPLHAAAQMGCLPCLKWMVQEQGIDPDLRDGDGATALHFAASRGHVETVRWLLRHGARLVLDKFGKSPLNDAAENEQIECLSILVQHGTLPDYSDDASENRHDRKDSLHKGSDASSLGSEPFFLHPPSLPASVPSLDRCPSPHSLHSLTGPEIYVNPMATLPMGPENGARNSAGSSSRSSSGSESSFYLHDPRDVIYNRVKDLFEVTRSPRASPDGGNSAVMVSSSGAVTVRVDVHTTSDTSELSEPSAAENDYEDIYQARHEASHSSRGSLISIVQTDVAGVTSVHVTPQSSLVNHHPPEPPRRNSQASRGSIESEEYDQAVADKTVVSPRHSLPPLHASNAERALKRVVSEPGGLQCPPPPPPPPPESPKATSDSPQNPRTMPGSRPTVSNHHSEASSGTACGGKHLVLPFVPPKFPSTDSDSLIKPSEYLRSIGKPIPSAVSTPPSCSPVQEEPPTTVLSSPGPPPPPPPALSVGSSRSGSVNNINIISIEKPSNNRQPLAAISIHDLSSVQLRRTDRLGKVLSAPLGPAPTSTTPQTMSPAGEPAFRSQKDDLIAELKRSRDISGIRKIRVERARSEEREDKERFAKLSKQYSVDSFVEQNDGNAQVPERDATGNPIPAWKRQMLAKKAAERARKEAEERAQREAEEQRMRNIPAWKRQLMAQRKDIPEIKRPGGIYTTRLLPETLSSSNSTNSIFNNNNNEENTINHNNMMPKGTQSEQPTRSNSPEPADHKHMMNGSSTPIMPWRAQLRKTNSTLNLLE